MSFCVFLCRLDTLFVGLKVGIFGEFEWFRSSILVDKPGFGRVQSLVFPDGLFCADFGVLERFPNCARLMCDLSFAH